MSTVPQVYSDQFEQQPAVGDQDMAIMHAGVIVGRVYSAAPTDTFKAGTRVKIDVTVTTPGSLPRFVAAVMGEAADGVIKRTAQKALFAVGDIVEVQLAGNPSIMWQCCGQTVTPGLAVGVDANNFLVGVDGSHLVSGKALDYGTDSTMVRVIYGYTAC